MAQNVTVALVAKHTGKHPETVKRVFKQCGVKLTKQPGVLQKLVPLAEVNKFLRNNWPHVIAEKGEMHLGDS